MNPIPQSEAPPREPPRTFWSDFRRFFLRGLAGILPPIVTIALLLWAFNFIDRNIGSYVTEAMMRLMASGGRKPELITLDDALAYGEQVDEFDAQGRRLTREFKLLTHPHAPEKEKLPIWWSLTFRKYRLEVVGLLIGILLIYFAGYFLASFMGRTTWQVVERAFFRIPVVKAVYPHVKQVTDVFLTERTLDAAGVVAVEYPRTGVWSLGLVVGGAPPGLSGSGAEERLTVFIPYSPTPFTGCAIWVRRDEAIELPMTLDEAMRFVVSCGVVVPGHSPISGLPSLRRGATALSGPTAGAAAPQAKP